MNDRVSTGERYARASITSNLKVEGHQCDADKMLAAGYAQSGDERKMVALRLYRLQVTGDRSSLSSIVQHARALMRRRMLRRGNTPIPVAQMEALVIKALQWWISQQCEFCNGTGFETMEGAPSLSLKQCGACNGTRITPLKRVIPNHLYSHADWLTKEWDSMCADVIADMAKRLSLSLP